MNNPNSSDFSDSITESLKEALSKWANHEDVSAMKESAKEVADTAAEFVRKYPIQSLIGAVAIGYVLGSLTTKRKSL